MTNSKEFRITSADGLSVACARWDGCSPIRGVVQIAHGMGEHIGRYAGVIDVLVSAGLTVYGNDHRGHGRTAQSPAHLGDFGAGGFDLLLEDMVRLSHTALVAFLETLHPAGQPPARDAFRGMIQATEVSPRP